nr:hypothetical protein [bacterium]
MVIESPAGKLLQVPTKIFTPGFKFGTKYGVVSDKETPLSVQLIELG